jgi:hypothetical protein
MAERYELPPARLARWLDRWAGEHAPVVGTEIGAHEVVFAAADGSRVVCDPPFPPLPSQVRGSCPAFDPAPLLDHVRRERTVGVLLVRLGGHAAGVFVGERLVDSKVGSRLVHGRHRKGGSSSARFANVSSAILAASSALRPFQSPCSIASMARSIGSPEMPARRTRSTSHDGTRAPTL